MSPLHESLTDDSLPDLVDRDTCPLAETGYSIYGYDICRHAHAGPRTEEGIGGADHPFNRRHARPSWLRDQQTDRDALGRAAEVPRRVPLSAPVSAGRTRVAAWQMGRE